MKSNRLNAANLLTAFRLVAAPVLLIFAWFEYPIAFLVLLAISFFTDVLDGYVARRLGQISSFGSRLDTWSDVVIYSTIAMSSWWLWPDTVREQAFYIMIVIASLLLPAVVGGLKFKTITSYHTWSAKIAVALTGLSLYPLFLAGLALPFHWATLVCAVAATEEIMITLLMPEPHSDIRSLLWVIQNRDNLKSIDSKKGKASE